MDDKKPTKVEALELAVRHILYMENMLLLEHGRELNIGHIEETAKKGVKTFIELVEINKTTNKRILNKLRQLRDMNPSEELAEENPELKESIFGKKQKSCVLRSFQTLLTK